MNFITLAFSPLCRMNEVFRYASVYQNDPESLGEHTNEVSMMSYLIAQKMNKMYSEGIDIGVLLEKCLLHDADEVITGDVPRNTKYATTTVRIELNVVANKAVRMIEDSTECDGMLSTWEDSKNGKEGVILKITDMLCVAKKCITEVELRGNLSFLKVATELEKHLNRLIAHLDDIKSYGFSEGSYRLLSDLVCQSRDEITVIRAKYQNFIDKYHIRENVIEGED